MPITIASTGDTLIDAKNPRWGDAANTMIELEAKWSHYEGLGMTENDGYYMFLAEPNDVEAHGREILAQAKLGTYGTIADYDPNREPTEAIQE